MLRYKSVFTTLFLSVTISASYAQQRPAIDSAAVLIQEVSSALQLPSDSPIETLRQQLYAHIHTDYSGECAIATMDEPYQTLRHQLNKAVVLQRFGYHSEAVADRATGPARLAWFFNTAATTNRGGQAACETAVNTGMSNVNTRFQQAGFAAGQFVLSATNGVQVNQDWDAGAGGSADAGVLLYTFLDWIATNFPAEPGSFHLPIGVTHLSNMNGVAAIATGVGCGETGFNSEDDVFRGGIVTGNTYVTSSNVIAHEVGHNFSLPHNNSPAICPLGSGGNIAGYVMSAGSGSVWHPVSLTDLYTATNWNNAQGNEFPYFNFVTVPVELIYFNAYHQQKGNIIEWETASETEGQVYEVERSADGIHFEVLSTVYGKGKASNYVVTDDSQTGGESVYYRLKMVDALDKISYSRIVQIQNKASEMPYISPNPATDLCRISFSSESTGAIYLLQVDGRILMEIPVSEHTGTQYEIKLSDIPSGIYLLECRMATGRHIQKLIKQ